MGTTQSGPVGSLDRVVLVADRDDDDANGIPDGEEAKLDTLARVDLVTLDPRFTGATIVAGAGKDKARLIVDGKPVVWGARLPRGAQLQGLAPGHVSAVARLGDREWPLTIEVHGVGLRDGKNAVVDPTRQHASIDRTPPGRINPDDADATFADEDALRIVVSSPEGASLGKISVESLSADGASLDTLTGIKLTPASCDGTSTGTDIGCRASAPIRFVVDDVDRAHTLVSSRSVRAEVGGAIVVRDGAGKKLQAIRVAGPRATPVGPIDRLRLSIRPIVMRLAPGSGPAVGGTDAGAITALRQELALASATWGQCGITFGPISQMDVKVVNPPPPYLVALGDDVGLPASGGEIRLRIEGKPVSFTTKSGWSTRQAALELQRVATKAGFGATLSENARISAGAAPSVDVLVKKRDGQLASVELVSSSDSTMAVTVGSVDLADGLQHFGDTDSVAGTLEERTLVKAFEDGDPRTIEVIVVPFFAGGGRIGESFIGSDGSSMRNVVILDRAGVRARRTSLTLAHELGHVILDEPGHPDDYGIDTPTLLMDSDASDASPFGPRRITIDECARAVRQSGPTARVPLLSAWKLGPMRAPSRP
ncbi:hypothetical protein AKJ09_08901 [Labilithrix luteola]|uniref:Uncharacterized protein n=2 Tax=Labilithrix luteola TaxID=1391654 RepID=A0A0K1Q938_9BACT|nr:hypothetical protein AKJ09_08901 [Labilithrix luteola]